MNTLRRMKLRRTKMCATSVLGATLYAQGYSIGYTIVACYKGAGGRHSIHRASDLPVTCAEPVLPESKIEKRALSLPRSLSLRHLSPRSGGALRSSIDYRPDSALAARGARSQRNVYAPPARTALPFFPRWLLQRALLSRRLF